MKSVSLLAILGTGAATQIIDLSASASDEQKSRSDNKGNGPCHSVCSAIPHLCFINVREYFENDLCAPCLSCQEKACEDHEIGDDCTAPDGNTGHCNTLTSAGVVKDFMDYDVKLKCLQSDITAVVPNLEVCGGHEVQCCDESDWNHAKSENPTSFGCKVYDDEKEGTPYLKIEECATNADDETFCQLADGNGGECDHGGVCIAFDHDDEHDDHEDDDEHDDHEDDDEHDDHEDDDEHDDHEHDDEHDD